MKYDKEFWNKVCEEGVQFEEPCSVRTEVCAAQQRNIHKERKLKLSGKVEWPTITDDCPNAKPIAIVRMSKGGWQTFSFPTKNL